jgi:hypothetical protein
MRIGRDAQSLRNFSNRLARYYHTSINWMPFIGVNNSILMGQVNYVLRYHGLDVIPHSNLDYQAFFTSTNQFQDIFWTAFEKENPVQILGWES